MRTPRDFSSNDGYPRPQQEWQCGLADEGPPCPLGPGAGGHCLAATACHPLRDGDRWRCNRAAERGGPCSAGPGPDGACSHTYRCTPVRALRSRRGLFVAACCAGAIGAASMAFSSAWRNELINPGALAVHHAQLVDGASATMQCSQCHAAANGSTRNWLGVSATRDAAASQSALCMKCHEKSFDPQFAVAAHNVSLAALRLADDASAGASSAARRDAAEAIACTACHREHQGREYDLTAIADRACQACHRERYHSFADGHPDFDDWPYERRTPIAFNHASHALKHFAVQQREFACAACHETDAAGDRQLTWGYEVACATCHDKGLAVSLAEGVPLVALPTLDVAALRDAGHAVGAWPADADGDFDGRLSTQLRLLLAAKPQAAEALRRLGPEFDFFDLDPEDDAQLAAAAEIAVALREFVDDLAARGQPALADRLGVVLGRELTAAAREAVAGRLPPDAAAAFRARLFADADAADESPADPQGRDPAGGWFRDDATLSLRYQPIGHADPWLRAWLDLLAEAATGPHAEIAEPLLRAALNPTAAGQCGSCHSVKRDAAGRLAMQWRAAAAASDGAFGLTHFAHEAHVLQSQLADCTACHRVSAGALTAKPYASDDPRQFIADFVPLTKSSCVACHTAGAAGDGCVQCHRYHGEQAGGWRLEAGGDGNGRARLLPSRGGAHEPGDSGSAGASPSQITGNPPASGLQP